jgi:hypothetical protein
MPRAGLEPIIPASETPQTHSSYRTITGIDPVYIDNHYIHATESLAK